MQQCPGPAECAERLNIISNSFWGKKGRGKIRVLLVLIFGEKIIKVGGGSRPPLIGYPIRAPLITTGHP